LNFFLNLATDHRSDGGTNHSSEVAVAHVLTYGADDDGTDGRSGDAVRVFRIGHCRDLLIPAFLSSAGSSGTRFVRGRVAEVRKGRSSSGYRNTDAYHYPNQR
jgi:hypothetical protein